MNPKLFQECLDLYGADLERWPAERRREARAALQDSEGLRRLLEQERRFEADLAQALPAAPAGLAQRILAAAVTRQEPGPREAQAAPLPAFREWFRAKPALVLAGLLTLGFLLGAYEADRSAKPAAATDLASLYNNGEASWTSDLNSSY